MTDEIFEPLLQATIQLPIRAAKDNATQSKMNWREARNELKKVIVEGTTEQITEFLNQYPKVQESKFWQEQVTRQVLENVTVEKLKYLMAKGAKLLKASTYDNLWLEVMQKDNLPVFEFIMEQNLIEWAKMIQHEHYCLQYLGRAPKITQWLRVKFGDDLRMGDLKQYEKPGEQLYYETIKYAVGLLIETAQNKREVTGLVKIIDGLKKSVISSQYPTLWQEVAEDLWTKRTQERRPDLVQELLSYQIKPRTEFLVRLWYKTLNNEDWESFNWLAQSVALTELARETWPEAKRSSKCQSYQSYLSTMVDPSLGKLKKLKELGFDLMAEEGKGVKWIHRCQGASKAELQWMVRNIPEAFESKNPTGVTLKEKLSKEKQIFVDKELIRRAVISKHKPLRTKVVKHRL